MNSHEFSKLWCRIRLSPLLSGAVIGLSACGGGSNPIASPPPPPPPTTIALSGVVTDGPVFGGTLFVFDAAEVQDALDSVDPAGDRLDALNAATSIADLTRDPADEDQFALTVPNALAATPVFIVFDNTDAVDDTFKDTLANLESVVVLGSAGSVQRLNISLQTTLIAQQVRAVLDPDGDGTIISVAEIATAMGNAEANVLSAFETDSLGRDIYPPGFVPVSHGDDDEVHSASAAIGFLLRAAGHLEGTSFDEIIAALAADSADGILDGMIPVNLAPTPEQEALAAAVNDVASMGNGDDIAVFAVGPCSSAAVSLQQACEVDVIDDLFEGTAICDDIADEDDRNDCLADVEIDIADAGEECDAVFDARLKLCEETGDAAHDPMFGSAFAANFVDPLEIGGTVSVNPWFPLVTGNRWVYEGDGESIEVEVTGETKLIDGVTCVVVENTAREDGVVIEFTRDWYAQDLIGNVWYCGEIARNYELFEGDDPEEPELVDIEGSWKAGRDGAEPGILLPFDPEVGDIFRTEVSYGEAEDVIRIESITDTDAAPGGSCNGNCLRTSDFTPLDPGVEENKIYAPGIGLIVEFDIESGDRVELAEFTATP
ncbi:MAG: hypothetical protein O2880_07295 [Proteobacteria bacterium]|nr:hypothetical protein [Pseudomonadota bacterium]